MADYILYTIAGLALSFLLYLFFLKREKNFHFNRFYLLGTLVLCLIAPTLELNWDSQYIPVEKFRLENSFTTVETLEAPDEKSIMLVQKEKFPLKKILLIFYLFGSALFLIRFSRNLFKMIILIKSNKLKIINGFKLVETVEKGNPYSFFNYLFINATDLNNESLAISVINHELAHSKQLHSVDIIFLEFLSCFFWFNPFIWYYKREILENHEYLADSAVINAGIDIEIYSSQLINCRYYHKQPFISGFSFIKTKNRLTMLHKEKSTHALSSLKACIVLILFAGVFIISSFSPSINSKPFVVLVDAGHGGKDSGSLNEKEINLQISKYLRDLSKRDAIKIILIREKDEFLSLDQRIDFIKAHKHDMLLSIHMNVAANLDKRGVEAYYTNSGLYKEKSHFYSEILIKHQLEANVDKGEIKTANFIILKELTVPGVLLELGFLSNESDAKRLNDKNHQKLIASTIYAGLQEIKASISK